MRQCGWFEALITTLRVGIMGGGLSMPIAVSVGLGGISYGKTRRSRKPKWATLDLSMSP